MSADAPTSSVNGPLAPAPARARRLANEATLLVPALAGLVASTMLLVDYVRPAAVFCEEGGGCSQIKLTSYASFAGLPTPVFGVAGFAAYVVLALASGPKARGALFLIASLASGVALFLLDVQRNLHVWCKLCVIADTCTLLVAIAAGWRVKSKWDADRRERFGFGAIAALAVAIPAGLGAMKKAEPKVVPEVISRHMADTPKGMITIVDFVDFECPWCRLLNEELEPLLDARKDRVHVIRKQVPLRMHEHAMDAARAACCGEKLGKGDAMASALFKTGDLTPAGCERIASELGLSLEPYRACVQDPETDARIKSDQDEFKAAQGKGLPMLWIGDTKIEGAQPAANLERALDAALARAGS